MGKHHAQKFAKKSQSCKPTDMPILCTCDFRELCSRSGGLRPMSDGVSLDDGVWTNNRNIGMTGCRWESGRCKRRWRSGNRLIGFAVLQQPKQHNQGDSNRFKNQQISHRLSQPVNVGRVVAPSVVFLLQNAILGFGLAGNRCKDRRWFCASERHVCRMSAGDGHVSYAETMQTQPNKVAEVPTKG